MLGEELLLDRGRGLLFVPGILFQLPEFGMELVVLLRGSLEVAAGGLGRALQDSGRGL